MKTWLKILLPDDEYKERQMLIFLAEAAVVQVVLVLALMMISQLFFPMTSKLMLVICVFSIILYVGVRYIFSGIEYTEISTEKEYKKEVKLLRKKSIGFVVIYFVLSIFFYLIGSVSFFDSRESQLDFFIFLAIAGVFLFGIQYISLRKSYMKNKDLI
ncbi:hypothetical protein ACIQZG_16180 [Lysinibacillus sp. NPDC096418]|uniref:hypothetical protein n=1 Tax=Lysinibacillus sp. NPDC096418 TaxID=3364138 RepID=UPI00382EFE96